MGRSHASALLGFTVALTVLSGCAPIASFRPASGIMDGRSFEVGGGAAMIGPRPYVNEATQGAGQLWASGRLGKRFVLSGVAGFDTSAAAGGAALRFDIYRSDRLAVGVEPEVGALWVAAATPAAVRLVGETWLYTAPRFGTWGIDWSLDVPAGLSVHLIHGVMIRGEYAFVWSHDLVYYQSRRRAGAAVAVQF